MTLSVNFTTPRFGAVLRERPEGPSLEFYSNGSKLYATEDDAAALAVENAKLEAATPGTPESAPVISAHMVFRNTLGKKAPPKPEVQKPKVDVNA